MDLKSKLKKLSESRDSLIDWEKKKKEWITSVNELFSIIQDKWFCELEDEGLLRINTSEISVTEDHIGPYSINKMEISFPTGIIVLEPVGINIIGGDGRIDFYLNGLISKRKMLILKREKGEDNWFIISKQNIIEQEILTQSSFEKAIDLWIEE